MRMSSSKGDRHERRLRNDINEMPLWKAVRMPSSGGGTKEDLPDLHVWLVSTTPDDPSIAPTVEAQYAVEVKAFEDNTRLSNEEVDALSRYAAETGAIPVVIAHADYDDDYVFRVDELHSTDKGYTIRSKRDLDAHRTFDDFVDKPFFN